MQQCRRRASIGRSTALAFNGCAWRKCRVRANKPVFQLKKPFKRWQFLGLALEVLFNNGFAVKCLVYKNKWINQSMLVLVSLTPIRCIDVTNPIFHLWYIIIPLLPVVVHCRIRHLVARHKKVTAKSNDIVTGVTRKCNALPLPLLKKVTRYR